MNITIQGANKYEFEELRKVELEAWGEDLGGSEDIVRAPLKVFPDGYFIASVDGTPAGSFSSTVINNDLDHPIATWEEIASAGLLTKHNPNGNALYGVAIGVSYKYRGLKIRSLLLERVKEFAVELNLEFLFFGARIPSYHKYSEMDVQEYVDKKDENGQRFESELRLFENCGFKIDKILPGYMSGDWTDPASLDFGVLTYWMNPSYSKTTCIP